ncbi:MAG: response regulator [Treponema sp.]|nr:response regulator [Treponema sp.]
MKQRRRIVILLAIMAGFMGGILGLIYQSNNSARIASVNLFSSYTETLAKDIGLSFMRKKDYAEVCSLFPSVMRLDWDAVRRDMVRLIEQFHSDDRVYAYLIVLKDGTYFHSRVVGNPALGGRASSDDNDPNAAPFSLIGRDHFQYLIADNAAGAKLSYVSTQNISNVTGQKQTLFSSNIINDQGDLLGYFSFIYSAASMTEELTVLTRDVKENYGKNAAFYLIANDGIVLSIQKYDPQEDAYTERTMNTKFRVSTKDLPHELVTAINSVTVYNGTGGAVTYNENNKKKNYMTYAPVPGTDYRVFITMPYNSLNTLLYRMQIIVVALLIIVLGAIIAIIVFTNRLFIAKEEAVRANHVKSKFLSTMGHELRTPMVAIIGMTNIAGKTGDIEKVYDSLKSIARASNHLLNLINDILDISRIEANKFSLSYSECNLKDMFSTIINIIRFRTEEKRQQFVINIAPNLPDAVLCDEQRLSQVILNLLYNAVKFTPEGGTITFIVQKLSERDCRLVLQIEVRDTGIGISMEQQENLFKPFTQSDDSTSRRFGGAGLGLAIVKNIIDLMQGKIWIESQEGQGSAFISQVEVEQVGGKEGSGKVLEESGSYENVFTGKNILVAEDVEINQEIVGAMLEDTGCNIDFANNGREAVDIFKGSPEKFDIILMDMQMPEVDGLEATRQIRNLALNKAKNIPIIAVTANILREDVENCLKAGMNAHIGKPLDNYILMETLTSYLMRQ